MYSETKPKRKREDVPRVGAVLLSGMAGVWRFSRRTTSRLLRWTWLSIKWSAIYSWRMMVIMTVFTWKATVWSLRLPGRMLSGLVSWWRGPEPYFENDRERDIYRRIRRQFRRRNRFRLHTFFYLSVNAAFWLQWLYMTRTLYNPGIMNPVLMNYVALTVVTSLFLLFHFLQMRSAVAEEEAIEAALNRERHYHDYADSARYAGLTDDGEIVDEYYLEADAAKRKRR